MSSWSDAPALRHFLARVARRLAWIAAAEGAAMGFAIALLVALTGPRSTQQIVITGIVLALAGLVAGVLLTRASAQRVAVRVERRATACRNVVITATELIAQPERVRPHVGELVCRRAIETIHSLDPASLFPARRAATAFGATGLAWALAAAFNPHELLRSRPAGAARGTAAI